MSSLFGRSCSVIVDTVRVEGTDAMRVAFKVTKTVKPEPNTCEVKIYNLADSTRAKLPKKGASVILTAGYRSNAAVIFQGDARTVDHERRGTEFVTVVRCGDGERAYQFARFSESFSPGTSVADVVRAAAKALGLGLGNLEDELAKGNFRGSLTQYAHGYSAHGSAARVLSQLTKTLGLSWSIQNGSILILRGQDPAPGRAVLLTSETGLIGSPEHNAPDRSGKPPLLKFRSLLQPQIQTGKAVEIRSRHIRGQFRVESLEHIGDTAGQEWYTNAEAQGS